MKSRTNLLVKMAAMLTSIAAINHVNAESPSNRMQLEEIIVTAQKRSESLQSVPITINAFTGDDLVGRGVEDASGLSKITPGLVITTNTGIGQPYLRGIGTDITDLSTEGAVGLYVDGVYRISATAAVQEFNDVERIEVLKGPQGTLYGRNTTGGAINIITRDPSEDLVADLSVSFGNYDSIVTKGFISGGNETVSASIAAYNSVHDGFLKNLTTGRDLNDKDSSGMRGKVKINIAENWSAVLSGDYSQRKDYNGSAYTNYTPNPIGAILGGNFTTRDPEHTYGNIDIENNMIDKGASLTVRGDIGDIGVVSITGYRKSQYNDGTEIDGTDIPVIELIDFHQSNENFSQEIQLLSPSDARLTWIVGGYFFGAKSKVAGPIYVGGDYENPFQESDGRQRTRAYAAFGEATYDLNENFSVTGGLRYNYEKKEYNGVDLIFLGTFIPGVPDEDDWTDVTYKVSIDYHDDDNLLFFTHSKGFKSGTFNVVTSAPPVDPEEMKAYEIGGKHNIGSLMRANWGAFYYDYTNLQVLVVSPEGALTELINAGESEVYGLDIDITAALGSNLELGWAAEWLHSRYNDFPNALVYRPDPATGGFGFVANRENATDNTTIRSPNFTSSLQLRYNLSIGQGELETSISTNYNSGYYLDPGNTTEQGKFVTVDLRTEYNFSNGFALFAFGRNLTDKRVIIQQVLNNPANLVGYNEPRMYGVGFSYKY